MCVIVHLKVGQNLDYIALSNAMNNNSHGWGILMRDSEGRVDVQQGFPDKDTELPEIEKVQKLLEDNSDVERFLHVRNNTRGDDSKENLHPFCVYKSNKRSVHFMHNGTIANYGDVSHTLSGYNVQLTDKEKKLLGVSDSRDFAESVLSPLMLRFMSTKDSSLHDPFFLKVLLKFWGHNNSLNRGLLIPNSGPCLFIGKWENIQSISDDGLTDIQVSNDSYFSELIRGPLFDSLKKKQLEKQKTEREARALVVSKNTVPDEDLEATLKALNYIEKSYDNILNDLKLVDGLEEIHTPEGLAALAYITSAEFTAIFDSLYGRDRQDLVYWLLDHALTSFSDLHEDNLHLQKKLNGQQKFIEQKVKEINELNEHINKMEEFEKA